MTPFEYLAGGFAAIAVVTVLFPVHCIAVGGGLFLMGLCTRRIA